MSHKQKNTKQRKHIFLTIQHLHIIRLGKCCAVNPKFTGSLLHPGVGGVDLWREDRLAFVLRLSPVRRTGVTPSTRLLPVMSHRCSVRVFLSSSHVGEEVPGSRSQQVFLLCRHERVFSIFWDRHFFFYVHTRLTSDRATFVYQTRVRLAVSCFSEPRTSFSLRS